MLHKWGMKLEPEDIQEFKRIYREEFGEELSEDEAERRARQLLTFYETMYHILLKERARERLSAQRPCLDDSSRTDTV
jgi:hypothetical protein